MTTEAEDTYVPGWRTLVRAKAACSTGESALRPDGPAGRISARHKERLAGCTELEIKEPGICLNQNPGIWLEATPPRFRGGVAHRSARLRLSDSAAEGRKAVSEQASAEQPGAQGTRFARPRRWNGES
jgi:hypothetical protein